MAVILSIAQIKSGFRTVRASDLQKYGIAPKRKRVGLTAIEQQYRKAFATDIISALMAAYDMGTDQCILIDNRKVSYSTFTPYLKEAALQYKVKVVFRHSTRQGRVKKSSETSYTLVSLA